MTKTPFADTIAILEEGYYPPEGLAAWLTAPRSWLDGQTPVQALAAGKAAVMLGYIQSVDEGTYA